MISSMTAFGGGKATIEAGTVSVELKGVNSRFLDIQFRMPDELRLAEQPIRDRLTKALTRGKLEVRASFTKVLASAGTELSEDHLHHVAELLVSARKILPQTPSPSLKELLDSATHQQSGTAPELWAQACLQALEAALVELSAGREREGARLAQGMLDTATQITAILAHMSTHMPALVANHQARLAQKLKDTLDHAYPNGLGHISASEIFERVAAETSLFALRIDVAEELARLESHVQELSYLLTHGHVPLKNSQTHKASKSEITGIGKRLDFLFQEMNREANTLGSKAASMEMTRASMDLKLLIEQLREQAQNIE